MESSCIGTGLNNQGRQEVLHFEGAKSIKDIYNFHNQSQNPVGP